MCSSYRKYYAGEKAIVCAGLSSDSNTLNFVIVTEKIQSFDFMFLKMYGHTAGLSAR